MANVCPLLSMCCHTPSLPSVGTTIQFANTLGLSSRASGTGRVWARFRRGPLPNWSKPALVVGSVRNARATLFQLWVFVDLASFVCGKSLRQVTSRMHRQTTFMQPLVACPSTLDLLAFAEPKFSEYQLDFAALEKLLDFAALGIFLPGSIRGAARHYELPSDGARCGKLCSPSVGGRGFRWCCRRCSMWRLAASRGPSFRNAPRDA